MHANKMERHTRGARLRARRELTRRRFFSGGNGWWSHPGFVAASRCLDGLLLAGNDGSQVSRTSRWRLG